MVGSELPSPETEESTVTDEELLTLDGVTLTDERGRNLLYDIGLHDPPRRGPRPRRRRGQRPGRAGRDDHGHPARPPPAGSSWPARTSPTGGRASGGRPASATSRTTDTGTACCSTPRCGRTGSSGTRPVRLSVRGPWIDRGGARKDTERIVRSTTSGRRASTRSSRALSGGNQQKLIVGREMSGDPILLIAAHPTRGVDVGAQAAIWGHIKNARREGLAVLLISADLDELIGLSDRIEVILRGRLVGEFDPKTVTPQQLGSAMTGGGEEGRHERAATDRPEPARPGRRDRRPRWSSPAS